MIVVDNDVISYFWIRMDTGRSEPARQVRTIDANWCVPHLWRSEFRNVLRSYLNRGYLTYQDAVQLAQEAEADLADRTFKVSTADVLRLVDRSGHSAYDCEYVALAQYLDVPLVTGDKRLPDLFPETATLLEDFAS